MKPLSISFSVGELILGIVFFYKIKFEKNIISIVTYHFKMY